MLQKPKQIEKKQLITPAKVIIGVAIFCILAMASYKVYTIAFPSQADSKMNQIHSNKIISHAGSSSGQETSSQTGSQSSKSSRDSNKPIGVSQTVGRDIISSNMGTGSDDGEEGPSE
jgi:cytoskeletal protein RodZ